MAIDPMTIVALIGGAGAAIISAIFGLLTILRKKKNEKLNTQDKDQSLTDKIETFLHRWHRDALLLRSLSFLLGIIAIAASLVIATFTTDIGAFWTKIIAIISATSFGILKSFQINEKANGFRKAYRHLYKAYHFRYLKQKDPSIDELIEAYEQAVEIIGPWFLNIERPPDNAESRGS